MFCRTNLHQLLFELLDFTDVKLTQQVIHKAGHRLEQLLLFGCRDAVVIGDGQFCEAILISVESLVVVGLSGGIITELETIQGNAKWAEKMEEELSFTITVYTEAFSTPCLLLFTCDTECLQCSCSGRALSLRKLSAHAQS